MRKKVICAILAVIITAGGIGWYVYHSAQVKKQKFAAYTKALKDFRRSAKELTSAAYFIEWDYCGIGSDRKDWEKRSYILTKIELFLDFGM